MMMAFLFSYIFRCETRYGFNPGSVLGISSQDQGRVAALVAVNTTLAACTGALSAMFTSSIIDERRYVLDV